MTVYYADSSAIAKRYLREAGSDWIQALLAQVDKHRFVSAAVLPVEVIAAVSRAQRQGRIGPGQVRQSILRLSADARIYWQTWAVTDDVLSRAGVLAMRHPLRAYDAVHLAAALAWTEDLTTAGLPAPILISADRELLHAAEAEGLAVENPNEHP